MLTVSLLMTFSNPKRDLTDFRRTLAALAVQTQPLHETFLADNAPDEDKPALEALCGEYGVQYRKWPFYHWAIADGAQYQAAFEESTGQAIMVLCPHWVLAPDWVEKMVAWLESLGQGNIVGTDIDRHALPRYEGGLPEDWFAGYPDRFECPAYNFFDHAKFICYREDWIPVDQEFDAPDTSGLRGSCHGMVYWAWQQLQRGRRLWLARDVGMEHATATHSPLVLEHSLERHAWSEAIFRRKIGG